jgi:hypothetical protein
MNFKQYLNSKRNIIILLMCINSFALIVNVLEIKGEIKDNRCPSQDISHYILSDGRENAPSFYWRNPYQQNFWPFVKFLVPSDNAKYYCGREIAEFKGVFRYFDYSEFFVYSLIILLGFYIRWEYLRKQSIGF